MTFRVKVVKDRSFDERLFQFGKGFSSSGCEKTQLRFFGLRQISTFFHKLIVSNLAAINLNVVHPTCIKLTSVMSSSAITTNPNYTCCGLY